MVPENQITKSPIKKYKIKFFPNRENLRTLFIKVVFCTDLSNFETNKTFVKVLHVKVFTVVSNVSNISPR